jgi:hypothetical protein
VASSIRTSGANPIQEVKCSILICLLLLLSGGRAQGQPVSRDQLLRCLYDSLFQTSHQVVNGKLQAALYPQGNGHPYFEGFAWTRGMIGEKEANIPYPAVRYDLVGDDLLIQHFSLTGSHVIIVNKQIAKSFTLGSHKFYLLEEQPAAGFKFEPGYYESAYNGRTELWIRWKKFYSERSSGPGEYRQTSTAFIRKGDRFYKITNRRSLLRALEDRKDEVKSFLRRQGISVSRAGTGQLVSILRLYDEEF